MAELTFDKLIAIPKAQLSRILLEVEENMICRALSPFSEEVVENIVESFPESRQKIVRKKIIKYKENLDVLKIAEAQHYIVDVTEELNRMGVLVSDKKLEKMNQDEIDNLIISQYSGEVVERSKNGQPSDQFSSFIDIIKLPNYDVTNIFKQIEMEEIALALVYCTNAKRMDLIRGLDTDLQLKILEETDRLTGSYNEQDVRAIHRYIVDITNEFINMGIIVLGEPKQKMDQDEISKMLGLPV